MVSIADLRGLTIGLDTAPLIYYVEERTGYLEKVAPVFEALDIGSFRAVISTITLMEVLVVPLRRGDSGLATRYRDILLRSSNVRAIEVNQTVAETAARIRADYNTKPPDSIHLATAVVAGAQYFLTNDKALPSLPTLQMLIVDDLGQA